MGISNISRRGSHIALIRFSFLLMELSNIILMSYSNNMLMGLSNVVLMGLNNIIVVSCRSSAAPLGAMGSQRRLSF
jgi:hypothetical protein